MDMKQTEYYITLDKKSRAKAVVDEKYNSFRIVEFLVPPDRRNKGYGTAILNEILKDADSKCYKVSGVPASYRGPDYKKKLIEYYKKFGFEYVKQINEVIREPMCKLKSQHIEK